MRRRKLLSGKKRALLLALILLAVLLALTVVAMTHLKPVLTSLATARVSNTVNGIVSAAVNETIYSGGVVKLRRSKERRDVHDAGRV